MSTETAGDSGPAAGHELELETPASEGLPARAGTADSGPDAAGGAAADDDDDGQLPPGEAAPAAREEPGDNNLADDNDLADDDYLDDDHADDVDDRDDEQDPEDGEYDGDSDDAPGDVASVELIELAEVVEFDEPAGARRHARWRTRLLIAFGFTLAAAAIIVAAIFVVGSITHGFKKPVKVTYKTSALFSLKAGQCLDMVGSSSYTLISCDSAHEAEVFATFALPAGKWPGPVLVAADASSGCKTRLTSYLNPQLAISLTSAYVYPDPTAWTAGTRTVICEVRAASGDLTGSVQGASATAG
jgi:hypothetical protein